MSPILTAKAFDSVPHKRLIGKLYAYGIRGKLLEWIAVFLLDRRQTVMIQGSKSKWAPVTSGIPQGSVLGPTLFTLFVNDMPQQVSSCLKLFADDTKLYRRVTGGTAELQADLDALVKWSRNGSFHSKFTQFSSVQRSVQVGDHLLLTKPRLAYCKRSHERTMGGSWEGSGSGPWAPKGLKESSDPLKKSQNYRKNEWVTSENKGREEPEGENNGKRSSKYLGK